MTVRNGQFVAEHLVPYPPEERVQPNGVDLAVADVKRIGNGPAKVARFYRDGYDRPPRLKMEPKYNERPRSPPYYRLYPGRYAIIYDAEIRIPEGHVGRVYPRSRVMRSGCHLTSALWDQGYRGRGEGLLQVPRTLHYVDVEVDSALGQLVFMEADTVREDEQYEGTHQGERLGTAVEDPDDEGRQLVRVE